MWRLLASYIVCVCVSLRADGLSLEGCCIGGLARALSLVVSLHRERQREKRHEERCL